MGDLHTNIMNLKADPEMLETLGRGRSADYKLGFKDARHAAAKIAALDAADARAVVKPLVWVQCEGNFNGQNVWCFDALKWMWIVQNNGGQYIWCEDVTPTWAPASPVRGSFDTLAAAKAAAQADYETRIMSAITISASPLQAAAMRTRAAKIADQHRDRRTTEYDCGWDSCASSVRGNILALPLEATPAELLAEAGELPEIAALIETMKKADQALHDDGCRPTMWPRPQIAIALKPFSALETP